jgi:hypothetical protein
MSNIRAGERPLLAFRIGSKECVHLGRSAMRSTSALNAACWILLLERPRLPPPWHVFHCAHRRLAKRRGNRSHHIRMAPKSLTLLDGAGPLSQRTWQLHNATERPKIRCHFSC